MITDQKEQIANIDHPIPARLVVFDMDNTLLIGRFVDICADEYGFRPQLDKLRTAEQEPGVLTKKIARLFKGLSLLQLQKSVAGIPIVKDAGKVMQSMKAKGYIVGIVSDSYQFVVDLVSKKLGADFAIGNSLEFLEGKATGNVTIPTPFYYHTESACKHALCKTNVLTHLIKKYGMSLEDCIAVGDSENDYCIIKNAGTGVAFCPTYQGLRPVAKRVIEDRSFASLMEL